MLHVHWRWYSALTVAIVCVVLFRLSPAVAGPGIGRWHGTMGSLSHVSRPVAVDAPKAGKGSGEPSVSAMAFFFLSGMLLGGGGGFFLGRVLLPWREHRQHRQREIDELITQFHALFRERRYGKNPSFVHQTAPLRPCWSCGVHKPVAQ